MEGQFYRRKMSVHPFFGIKPRSLPTTLLPINGDIIGRLLMKDKNNGRIETMEEESKYLEKHVQMEKCIKKACDEIFCLWKKLLCPTRSRQCVLKRFESSGKLGRGSEAQEATWEPASAIGSGCCLILATGVVHPPGGGQGLFGGPAERPAAAHRIYRPTDLCPLAETKSATRKTEQVRVPIGSRGGRRGIVLLICLQPVLNISHFLA